mgnify:CR=1 FL=1
MNQVEVKRRQIQSFSYVLACINIWVFGKSIGDNGLGYLAAAVLVFALFWVLTGKNLPDRMGRMLRGRNARGQYRNVSRMRKNMMLFQIAEGLLGTVLCMSLGWILLEKVFLVPYGSMILWILSPALFLRCIQSVFLGYFQSEGSEMPSAVSSVLRQVFFLGLGLVFLGIFRNYGEKVSLLLKRADFTSMYGAMGIAVGMLLSEVLVLLFVFVIYRGSMAGRREAESGMKGTDSFSLQLRTLLIPMGGDILRDMFLLLPLWIGLTMLCIGTVAFFIYTFYDKKLDASLEEEGAEPEEPFRMKDIWLIVTNKGFWLIALLCVLFYSAVFPFLKYATDLMVQKYNVDPELAGTIPSLLPLGTLFLTPLFGNVYDRIGKGATLMIIGSVLLIFVHTMFALPVLNVWWFATIIMIILGIGFSLVPSAMWPSVPKIIPEKQLGTAYALIFWVQNWGLMGVPALIGFVLNEYCKGPVVDGMQTYDYTLPMWIFAGFGVAALFFALWLKGENKKKGYGLEEPNIKK